MLTTLLKYLLTGGGAYLLWTLARILVFPHPLDKVPGPPPQSIVFGHIHQIFAPDGHFHDYLVEKYGRAARLFGLFKRRILYIHDPKALHHIFIKDQHIYEESQAFAITTKYVFGEGLLASSGARHRKQRKMLNPVFSIAYLKRIIPGFFEVAYKVRDVFLRKTADGPQEVEMVSWLTRGALEILSENALGYTFDPITEGHNEHPYVTAVKGLGPLARKPSISFARMVILPFMEKAKFIPRSLLRFVGDALPWQAMHEICAIVDVMTKTSQDVLDQAKRKVALEGTDGSEDTKAKDLISILIRENAKASEEDRLPENEVLGQISTFVFAGMDTTSNALCRLFWILSNDQTAQVRLRAEIREAKGGWGSEPSYDQLASLPYLDAVCRETMRLYAPATAVTREAVKDAILPLSKPIRTADGKEDEEIYVSKGSFIMVSIGACNTSKELWGADAHEWRPDRWLSPIPEAVAAARIPGVYSHLMTFIGGGRSCIGFKFSEMEMKVIIFVLLDLFHFAPSQKDIYWNHLGIVVPSTSRETLHPEMPLVVSRAP